MSASLDEFAERKLAALEQRNQRRTLIETERLGPVEVKRRGMRLISFSCNDYLNLSQHQAIKAAAVEATEKYGVGAGASRLVTGNHPLFAELEAKLAKLKGAEAACVFGSGYLANTGIIPALAGVDDMVVVDKLSHACIFAGAKLTGGALHVFRHNDTGHLGEILAAHRADHPRALIVTDGVFSMDGYLANLPAICDLADEQGALVMVDDSHAVGFMGARGRGTHEHHDVMGRIDILTGTLGKALGGASGGYTSGRAEIIEYLRQRSRPYLFSNTVAPSIVAASIKAIELLNESTELRDRLEVNTNFFREQMADSGFHILEGTHPITPIMLGEAALASRFADAMLDKGIYVIGFSFPVVPKGKARIRTQISAAHTRDDLEFAIAKFAEVKTEMGI